MAPGRATAGVETDGRRDGGTEGVREGGTEGVNFRPSVSLLCGLSVSLSLPLSVPRSFCLSVSVSILGRVSLATAAARAPWALTPMVAVIAGVCDDQRIRFNDRISIERRFINSDSPDWSDGRRRRRYKLACSAFLFYLPDPLF